MTGFVNGNLLEELFSNAYMYVLPSEIEGLPISLLEAMSYGHCCLVSDIEQNLEVIQSYGYSFESKNSDDLYEKLKELLDDENKILDVRSKVKEYVNNKYNWDKVSEDTEKAYKALKSK